jgi:hypothetical protein
MEITYDLFSLSDDSDEEYEERWNGIKVFTIKVYGERVHSDHTMVDMLKGTRGRFRPITFDIYKQARTTYLLTCKMDGLQFRCGMYNSYHDATRASNTAMKLAMKNQLFFRYCWGCGGDIYYPSSRCCTCNSVSHAGIWNIQNLKRKEYSLEEKIEKINNSHKLY